jgi:SAM-dependent methyltransferase
MTWLFDHFGTRFKDYLIRWASRRVAGRSNEFEILYILKDPWHLNLAKEQTRFDWTNQIISAHFSRLDTIFEIGCGEGHQSQYLSQLCTGLYGIDLSKRAVKRARRRCPNSSFAVGDPFTFSFANMPPIVDLVVACEVLYYVDDIPQMIKRLSQLGRACLVTYYQGQAPQLDPHFSRLANCKQEQFRFDGTEWNAVWWRNPDIGDFSVKRANDILRSPLQKRSASSAR